MREQNRSIRNVFDDKVFRRQGIVTVIILVGFILLLQLAVIIMTEDFKQTMIDHDYAIAGYLAGSGLDAGLAIEAITADKNLEDISIGQSLLGPAGYDTGIRSLLLPELKCSYRKNSLIAFAMTLLFSIISVSVFLKLARLNDRRLVNAEGLIRRFMDGESGIRLDDSEEGSLSRLFASVNEMVTSLTAHIEKEKQSRQFLKDMISNFSHQLKTPLAAMKMYNDIIWEEKTGNEVVESFTSRNQRELERMESLIQSLLMLAKLDAGTIELEKSRHGLMDFLDECIRRFATRAELEGKEIRLSCDDDLVMSFDEAWLSEAVCNMIKNALDHTEKGEIIEISGRETPVAVEIHIKDSGKGIHPDDVHHIFKRFYRSRFSKDRQGIGIGLALSKAVVERHGGTITVQSELGSGAEFNLIFSKLI
jgi:signal transduction histidine kinase